jgi:predicted MPP superfamily phosphohydrolase
MAIAFLLFLSLLFLIDWYAFQGVRSLTEGWSGHWGAAMRWAYWMVSLAPLSLLLLGRDYYTQHPGARQVVSIVFSVYLGLLISKLVFVIPHLFEDLIRLFQGITGWHDKRHEAFLPERRRFVSQMAIGVAALPFTAFLYGIVKGKYNYKVHRHTVRIPGLPEAFKGFTITQISDVHAGSFDSRSDVLRGLDMIADLDSDLLVFTGDMVNNRSEEFAPWVQDFGALKARFGKFSILGNHDYADYFTWPSKEDKARDLQQLKQFHADAGFRLLLNEHVNLEKDGQQLTLIGVENWGKDFVKHGDLSKALQYAPADTPKILLSHDPSHWEMEVKTHPTTIHLTLSGHTHGMQMGVEIPGLRWSPVKFRYPKWAGLYTENERYLHVNRGFGFLGFSGRVGIWPEITVLTLEPAPLS